MYWSSQSGTRIPAIADAMPVNRFFKLRLNLHIVDVNDRQENDRLLKVWPFFDSIKRKCKKNPKRGVL